MDKPIPIVSPTLLAGDNKNRWQTDYPIVTWEIHMLAVQMMALDICSDNKAVHMTIIIGRQLDKPCGFTGSEYSQI